MAEPLLVAEDLVRTYRTDSAEQPVLRGVSLQVGTGEWVAVMGPSGCGKSTLLHVLGGLDAPDRGSVHLGGDDVTSASRAARAVLRRTRIGYVFQAYNLIPHLDVTANVVLPQRLAGVSRRDARTRAAALLDALGLADSASQLPGRLSGGQQQRVAIARALANRPDLLLADEPTGALDSAAAATVLDLLRAQHNEGQAIVMVTHADDVAAAADRVVRMRDGLITDG